MSTELQRLVDGLGKRLQRNVTVDDSRLRQLAFSSHEYGAVDELRVQSIFKREVPMGAAEWTFGSGARTAERPFRPPLAPEIGATLQRLCVPIRLQGTLLGFLWILENEDVLDDTDLRLTMSSLDTIGILIQRDLLAGELHRSRARELLRDLVVPDDPTTRRHAAAALIDDDLFVASEPVVAVVITLHPDDRALLDTERDVLAGRLERISGRLSERRHISLVRRDHGVLLLSDKDPMIIGKARQALLQELLTNLGRELTDVSPHAGIGGVVPNLGELHQSYRQAQWSVRVARAVPGVGPVASFDDLGVYGLLVRIPPEELTDDILPPPLRRLFACGIKGEQLASVLEVFLDNAGDVQATAQQLFIHRTTLYYRLQKIEELSGLNLATGENRLACHLGLKIARLTGKRMN